VLNNSSPSKIRYYETFKIALDLDLYSKNIEDQKVDRKKAAHIAPATIGSSGPPGSQDMLTRDISYVTFLSIHLWVILLKLFDISVLRVLFGPKWQDAAQCAEKLRDLYVYC